ncbi:sirohydrochlorin chelatase [Nocardioides insulae]|uniref:sirohydrochlorin chelatase n=1 Tax=Nocardioides insulae TaxID=394734 RepID=UPI0004221089|nr:CbiX/SirB N-terminal domain-containing protein [Nocardioides insulae]
MTRLVTIAHGTRLAYGNTVASELTRAAGERLGIEAVTSYVELCSPLVTDVLGPAWPGAEAPTVAVPLLLSTGHHVRHDLPAAVATSYGPVRLGGPLGPDPLLAHAMVARLRTAGARPGQPVVMVAAGSRDPRATADLDAAAALLAGVWGTPVRWAALAGLGRRPAEVIRPGDAVASYLLAPGYFADRARSESLAAGAGVVSDVLGTHPLLVDLLVTRTESLLAAGDRMAGSLLSGSRRG